MTFNQFYSIMFKLNFLFEVALPYPNVSKKLRYVYCNHTSLSDEFYIHNRGYKHENPYLDVATL